MKLKFLLTLVIISVISSTFSFGCITPAPTDRTLLIELYKATNGDNWTNNSGWKTPPLYTDGFAMPGTEGSWFGVTLGGSNEVYQINLRYNNLTGSLPSAIGKFKGLQYLYLIGNSIEGTIPNSWGTSTNLQALYLSANKLTGNIPTSIGNLKNLLYLDLSNNQLTGGIPCSFQYLTVLRNLILEHNAMQATIPSWLGNTKSLRFIDLAYNKFYGSIPSTLGGLYNMVELYLDHNNLSNCIPSTFGNLSALKVLFLCNNKLSGSIPTTLGNLYNLNYLVLNFNCLSGKIPSSLGNLENLTYLALQANKFKGLLPETLINLQKLTFTDLGYNALYLDSNAYALDEFLAEKDSDWKDTQTVAPVMNSASSPDGVSPIQTTWELITYLSGNGGYEVYYSTKPNDPNAVKLGITDGKNVNTYSMPTFDPTKVYYFKVKTVTNPYWNNQNIVISDFSNEVSTLSLPPC